MSSQQVREMIDGVDSTNPLVAVAVDSSGVPETETQPQAHGELNNLSNNDTTSNQSVPNQGHDEPNPEQQQQSQSHAAAAAVTATAEVRELVCLARENIAPDVPLINIVKLDLGGCGLSSLPNAIPELLPNLSILFLSSNKFTEMPAILGQCPKLQMIAFKDNGLTSIHPESLPPQLRWLILTNNQLTEIPDSIGMCTMLQKCMLSGNRLTSLPTTIANLHRLELIRLASNGLTEPPMILLQLPQLKWVALGDNPFLLQDEKLSTVQTATSDATIILKDLDETSGIVLGRGAGGTTLAIEYHGQTVAVKVYGGIMTSDGLPETERKVSLAASQLNGPAFIKVLGQCEGTGSLVMEYLENFAALAAPPSFESCTRDVYGSSDSPCLALSWEEASHLISVVLDALVQLHRSGITHGDLYAHNILVQRHNLLHVRLSDFGAAFFYNTNARYGKLLEIIELRAFAVLVDEVSALLNEDPNGKMKQRLTELVAQCHNSSNASFDHVHIWWQQMMLADMAKAFGVDDP